VTQLLNRVASLEESSTIVCFALNKAGSPLSDLRGGLWHVLLGAAETVASYLPHSLAGSQAV